MCVCVCAQCTSIFGLMWWWDMPFQCKTCCVAGCCFSFHMPDTTSITASKPATFYISSSFYFAHCDYDSNMRMRYSSINEFLSIAFGSGVRGREGERRSEIVMLNELESEMNSNEMDSCDPRTVHINCVHCLQHFRSVFIYRCNVQCSSNKSAILSNAFSWTKSIERIVNDNLPNSFDDEINIVLLRIRFITTKYCVPYCRWYIIIIISSYCVLSCLSIKK